MVSIDENNIDKVFLCFTSGASVINTGLSMAEVLSLL
jgi:hypothetical protein